MALMLRPILERAARRYVAGPELADALRVAAALRARGEGSTLAYWNDSSDPPAEVRDRYLAAVDGAPEAGLGCYVSIKAPALRSAELLVREVVDRAAARRVGAHFDALGFEEQARVFELLRGLRGLDVRLGCTLPGRFATSPEDAERAVALGARVRVVKGQWDAPRGCRAEPRRGFLEVVDRLSGRATHVAVATHDPGLAREALERLLDRATSAELELLYGLPGRPAQEVAARLGVPVRVYVPYGHAWLPYSLAQAGRNPRVLWWMAADALRGAPP